MKTIHIKEENINENKNIQIDHRILASKSAQNHFRYFFLTKHFPTINVIDMGVNDEQKSEGAIDEHE